ncbi:Cutinase [Mycena venus]|uniref:cutinase n=1 Tax=Mycena venus TaxID=2733690 RepID=A0A8H6YTE2_9AGAR|nr:Cutinase [Mycena venus]
MLRSLLGLVALSLLVIAAPIAQERAANACTDVIVIFARGTTEAAPIGSFVGPPLQAALQSALGGKSLTFTGVDYAADIAGFLEGGDPTGSATMAQDASDSVLLKITILTFIQAALVTSGYDQGGQLVHNSARMLSASVLARIKAAVIFGDPDDGEAVHGVPAANTDVICHVGDDICLHGDLILPAHLTYGMDTPAAAAFIAARV